MELSQQAMLVTNIHDKLVEYEGKRVRVRANLGRSKIIEAEGVLTQAHPSLFIIEAEAKRGRKVRQSYQYVDVLTGMVELTDPANDNEPLFQAFFTDDEEIEDDLDELDNIEISDEDVEDDEDDEDDE